MYVVCIDLCVFLFVGFMFAQVTSCIITQHRGYCSNHNLIKLLTCSFRKGKVFLTKLRATNLMHVQAELAQQEAQQLQEAGYFAEAAALSTTAHKWRKRAAKVSLTGADSQTLVWVACSLM